MTLPPFQRLVDLHARDLRRFLVACVGPIDADDCLQETLLSALRAYPKLQDASNLRGWLVRIARNKALAIALGKAKVTDAAGKPVDLSEFTAVADAEAEAEAEVVDEDEEIVEEAEAAEKPAPKKRAPKKKADSE